jgi:hypothetical protein
MFSLKGIKGDWRFLYNVSIALSYKLS